MLQIADFWKEAELLSSLHHPNVVAFYGVVKDKGKPVATVTEYMVNGSLKQVLQKKDRWATTGSAATQARMHRGSRLGHGCSQLPKMQGFGGAAPLLI